MADPYADLEALDQEDSDSGSVAALANLDREEPAPAAPETSWWSRAASEMMDPQQWKRQALLAGRAAAQGVASLPLMVMDAGVGARNLLTGSDYATPSSMWDEALNQFLPKPESRTEKVANFAESVLAGSRLPAPEAGARAPANFVPVNANPLAPVLQQAQEAGYVVPPSSANPSVVNQALEGISGKAATAQQASIRNQEVTNRLTRQALGMAEDAPITPDSLRALRATAGQVYNEVASSGRIATDAQYLDDLGRLGRGVQEIARDFPEANVGANQQIDQLVNSLLRDHFDARSALAYLRQLRADAAGNISAAARNPDPARQALGMAQREAAGTLEDLIGRHLAQQGNPQLAQSFEQARRLIAMSHTVENALNETTGNVVAGKLGQELAKGRPLNGELEVAARFARAFPKAAKEVTESMPGISPLDVYASLGTSLATSNILPAFVPAARVGIRNALLGPRFQAGLAQGAEQIAPQAPNVLGLPTSALIQGTSLLESGDQGGREQ